MGSAKPAVGVGGTAGQLRPLMGSAAVVAGVAYSSG